MGWTNERCKKGNETTPQSHKDSARRIRRYEKERAKSTKKRAKLRAFTSSGAVAGGSITGAASSSCLKVNSPKISPMRFRTAWLFLAVCCSLVSAGAAQNILLIIADDYGADS